MPPGGGAGREAGRSAEEIAMREKTVADRERVLGPDHPETLSNRNNLAATYRTAGRIAEAIQLHEKTVAGRERVFGPNHPDTLPGADRRGNPSSGEDPRGLRACARP